MHWLAFAVSRLNVMYIIARITVGLAGPKNDTPKAAAGRSEKQTQNDQKKKDTRRVEPNGAWNLDPKAPQMGHAMDGGLCRSLEQLFKDKDVLDLGSGLGNYGRCLLHLKYPLFPESPQADKLFFKLVSSAFVEPICFKHMYMRACDWFTAVLYVISAMMKQSKWWDNSTQQIKSWTGYDGSPNVEEVTKGLVKHLDLSKPQNLGRKWDWVMSLEVGEHIPKQFEDIYITNLLNHASYGVVLSWAIRGQGGTAHVNCLNNTEVVERLEAKGFFPDYQYWEILRKDATLSWFRRTLMVFKPDRPSTWTYYTFSTQF